MVKYEVAKSFAEEKGLAYIETSAKTGESVPEAFALLAEKLLQEQMKLEEIDLNSGAPESHKLPQKPAKAASRECGCTIL
jgi:hypothetical protein